MTAISFFGIAGIVSVAAGFLIAAQGMSPAKPNPKLEHWGYYILGIGVLLVLSVSVLTSVR